MDDVTDFTAEELSEIQSKYGSYTFDPFVSRAGTLRDPFAIVTQTFRNGDLITEEKGKAPRRIIESKAADVLSGVLADSLAWDPEAGVWYLFTGTHWAPQTTSGKAESLIAHAVHIGCGEMGYRLAYLSGITTLMQRRHLLKLPTFKAGLIPFTNGVLDIGTGQLKPATPTRSLAWCLPHDYDPQADCPTVKAWLLRNVEGDGETVELLRAWLAALVRGLPLQKFLLLIGRGGTGKSTFARLAMALVGDGNTAISALRDLEQNRFELAKVFGKRLLLVNEAGRHGGAVNQLKALTGGDPVPLERKHQQQQGSFVFQGLTLLASNEDLVTTDGTSGLERRRITVSFPITATPEERADWQARGGEAKVLHSEIPGLVNWCLKLSEEEIRSRIDKLPPRVVADNISGMCSNNSCADWLMHNCVIDPEAWGQIGHRDEYRGGDGKTYFSHAHDWLYPNYLEFCHQQGRRNPVSIRKFATTLIDVAEQLGHRLVKARHPRDRYFGIKGLDLRKDGDPAEGCETIGGREAPYSRKDRKDQGQNLPPINSATDPGGEDDDDQPF